MDEDDEKTKGQMCISGCKQLITLLLSHVGILTIVVSYCLIGAVTFEALEAGHEIEVKKEMVKVREAVSQDLWKMTKETDIIIPERWSENASRRLIELETELLKAIRKGGWDGSEDEEQLNWTFTGALFYSIVVTTTIGYGHIVPKTAWGKMITIFYAIIGIPLMVILWSHVGDFMANSFRFIYWRVCCYLCTKRAKSHPRLARGRSTRTPNRSSSKKRSIRRSQRVSQRSHDSAMSISDSGHSAITDPGTGIPMTGQPYRSGTFPRTTQPKGLPHPSHQMQRQRSTKSVEREIPNMPVLFNKHAEDLKKSGEEVINIQRQSLTPPTSALAEMWKNYDDYWDDESDYNEDSEEEIGNRPVPVWLCSSLVIGYIVGGAYLFSSWEGWNLLDSAYFCFITLSTIGFGDFVPTQDSKESIALCSLYLLFGIVLLVMSFNLVQEQVINSVKRMAMILGILDDDDER